MFYHVLYPLYREIPAFNVFKYITFRSFLAFVFALVISIFWGKRFIAFMKLKQFGQSIREDGPESHFKKRGTPTLGGIFIIGSILGSLLFVGNYASKPFVMTLIVMTSYFLLGWLDDYLKVIKKNSDGVSGKFKLAWQFSTAIIASYFMLDLGIIDSNLYIPFVKDPILDLGYGYILFASIVIVGSSNAVNLTDGLDGLVTGPVITSSATFAFLAYIAGHTELSSYLYIPYVQDTSELTVLCAAVLGASVGFLWYNCNPAQIFMGDVGSLSLGGLLGTVAVLTKNEFLFVIIGGIFVMEAVSVILQVGSYKLSYYKFLTSLRLQRYEGFSAKIYGLPFSVLRSSMYTGNGKEYVTGVLIEPTKIIYQDQEIEINSAKIYQDGTIENFDLTVPVELIIGGKRMSVIDVDLYPNGNIEHAILANWDRLNIYGNEYDLREIGLSQEGEVVYIQTYICNKKYTDTTEGKVRTPNDYYHINFKPELENISSLRPSLFYSDYPSCK